MLLCAAATASVDVPQPPFSWRTVPVFAETSNVTGAFDSTALSTLRRFPLVVAEKAYDYAAPGYAEDKLAKLVLALREGPDRDVTGQALKRPLHPFLVFYYNANLDLTDYRLHATFTAHAPSWWLRNSSGVPFIAPIDSGLGQRPPFPYNAHGGGVPVFDHTVAAARTVWVQECFDMRRAGFDGCMVDRWTRTPFKSQAQYEAQGYTKAQVDAWFDAMQLSLGALVDRTRAEGTYLVGGGAGVDAVSVPGYGAGALKGDKSLAQQLVLADAGQGLLASYRPGSTGADLESQLASFLVGAAPGHYFGAGSWTCNHTSREGVTWHDEYDRPLGAPLGNGTRDAGGVWTRNFTFGTNVSFDANTGKGTIAWGTFPAEGSDGATIQDA